jgi:hypothetical protein
MIYAPRLASRSDFNFLQNRGKQASLKPAIKPLQL